MVDRLLSSLFALTVAFSAASLLVVILREPCRRLAGSAFVYWLWLLVPLAVAAALLPALPHPAAPAASFIVQGLGQPLAAKAVIAAPAAPSLVGAALQFWRDLTPCLIGAWGFGLLAFLCRIALMQRRFMDGLGRLTRDPGRPNVFYSEKTGVSPSVVGMLRSRIVLPADFNRFYGADEQTLIMAHERTHVRERHPTAGALGVLIVAAQWFNPLAYLALSLFRIDQELACDAAVVTAHPSSRAAYAKAMLKARIGGDYPPLAYCWISRLSLPMKDRISLLKLPTPSPGRRAAAMAMLTMIASASAVAAYAMVPHPEISLSLGAVRPPVRDRIASLPAAPMPAKPRPASKAVALLSPASSSVTVTRGGLSNVKPAPEEAPAADAAPASSRLGQQTYDNLVAAKAQGANVPIPVADVASPDGKPRMFISLKPGTDLSEIFRIVGATAQANGKAANPSVAPDEEAPNGLISADAAAKAIGPAGVAG